MNDPNIETILRVVGEKIGCNLLVSDGPNHQFHIDRLICRDLKGFFYAIIGNWWRPGEFVVRGVVRQTRRYVRWTWLCNGQAGNCGKQVGLWAEGDFVVQED